MSIVLRLLYKVRKILEMRRRKLKITRKFNKVKAIQKLSSAQKKEIQDFYVGLIGKKVPLYQHQYFYSRTGVFSKDYIPSTLYYCDLLPKANVFNLLSAYNDKNISDILFPGENLAHTILKNMNGYYYYEGEPVSKEKAILLCSNIGDVIIKPSKLSQGEGVQCVTVNNGIVINDGLSLNSLFDKYKRNFQIQQRVRQHKDMAALNPSSVNTLRILTYRSDMEVLVIYSVIRIGRMNQVVDNQSAGGLSTTISKEGRLGKYAFGSVGNDSIEKTDTGVLLADYQIPSYDKAIAFVKRLHLKLPFFNIIGWDVAIDEKGEPLLIEFNTEPGLSQSAFGSGMGEYTERIIRELWPRPNTRFPEK